jgi:hypothetical protein
MYKYVSPMLLVNNPSNVKYDLHMGTSFDYLFVLRKSRPGIEIRNKILAYFLEGLLKIIDEIERGLIPKNIEISGSSYFFSERTAKRIGFEIGKTDVAVKTNIVINYPDLVWMYSLANGKIKLPKLSQVKTARISGKTLKENKTVLQKLYKYITKKMTHKG